MAKKAFADQSQKCCLSSGLPVSELSSRCQKLCRADRDVLHPNLMVQPRKMKEGKSKWISPNLKPRVQLSSSKKERKTADPILACTVLWSTLVWQLIRELFASVCHLKKTAATWRGAHGSSAVTTTAESKAPTLSLLRTLLLPLWLLLDLSVYPSI